MSEVHDREREARANLARFLPWDYLDGPIPVAEAALDAYRDAVEARVRWDHSWAHQIADGVFHVLHPECPAYPGEPSPCSPLICDCFAAENSGPTLAEQVQWLKDERDELRREVRSLRAFKAGVDDALNSGDGSYRP